MYLFWELVGVSSYLLIGFYYTKPAAIAASKKAFIVTRFADLGFLIGILVYGYYAGTYTFQPDEMALLKGGATMIPLALGLMFIGGAERAPCSHCTSAARCNGRSYSRQRTDPRRHNGGCRRVSGWHVCSRSS